MSRRVHLLSLALAGGRKLLAEVGQRILLSERRLCGLSILIVAGILFCRQDQQGTTH